jgi:hypothetical protein
VGGVDVGDDPRNDWKGAGAGDPECRQPDAGLYAPCFMSGQVMMLCDDDASDSYLEKGKCTNRFRDVLMSMALLVHCTSNAAQTITSRISTLY